ncbi:hypothetical protein D9613_009838 [Agrocybe pediades]|uniref:Peptidase C14 caspase domain-containing protein n=1 Tax=Agrocybe pediades TaxID=84607 RepID=A0A8H4QYI5_9AGAR|nr:hypothetical protein D9613_009838 [Agrocybe pediades]
MFLFIICAWLVNLSSQYMYGMVENWLSGLLAPSSLRPTTLQPTCQFGSDIDAAQQQPRSAPPLVINHSWNLKRYPVFGVTNINPRRSRTRTMKIINFSKPKQALRMLRRKGPPPPIAVPGDIHLPPTAPRAIAAVPPPHPDVQEQEPTAAPDTELEYEEATATTSEAVHPQPLKKIKKKALLIGIQLVREKPVEPLTALSPLSPRFAIANVDAGIQRAKTKYRAKKRARAIRKSGVLKGPHKDVAAMKNLLINVYNYAEEDIVVLIDDDDANHKQPTKANIMDEMRKLVAGAEENDRFFFHFSGHSMQEDTDDIEEEDRKNEFIMTSDGDSIKDDQTHLIAT